MGWPQPSLMELSISSMEPTPSSRARTASSRYGTSKRLTMKPVRSVVRTGVLPKRAARATAASSTFGSVAMVRIISTNFITGTGLKKCMPRKRSGHFGDGKRRSVAGENRVRWADVIERGPQLALGGQLLDNRFDDQIGILQVLQVGCDAQASANLIAITGRKRAFVHQPLQIFVDGLQSFIKELLGHF